MVILNALLCLHNLNCAEMLRIWKAHYSELIPGMARKLIAANPKVAAVNQVHWQNLQAKNKKAAEASDKKTKKQRLTSTMLQRRVIKPGQGVTKRVMAVALGLKGKKAKSLPKDQLVAATLRQQDDPGLRKWFTSTATSKMIKSS